MIERLRENPSEERLTLTLSLNIQELQVLEELEEQQGISMESYYEFAESIQLGLCSPTPNS